MAFQKGILEIKGTIGNLTYYHSMGKSLLRRKSSLTKAKQSRLTKLYGQEFGKVNKDGAFLRSSFRDLLQYARDARHTNSLIGKMLAGKKEDAKSKLGKRTFSKGNMNYIDGFSFNSGCNLNYILKGNYECVIDREAGTANFIMHPLCLSKDLNYPAEATHIKILNDFILIDIDQRKKVCKRIATDLIRIEHRKTVPITHSLIFDKEIPLSLIVTGCIQFYQEVNGQMHILKDRKYNALDIVGVDQYKI